MTQPERGWQSRRGTTRFRVAYADTDQARVVHHASYFRFLEMARIEFWREAGLDYRLFEETTGLGLPVVEARMRYRSAARFDDVLEVDTSVDEATRASVWYAATIRRASGEVAVESRIRLACVVMSPATGGSNVPAGSLVRIPDSILDASLLPGWAI